MACLGTIETPKHIFFNYFKAQCGWDENALFFKADPYSTYLVDTNSFIDILDSALAKTTLGTARIYVVYHTVWTLCLHKNNRVYQDRPLDLCHASIPIWQDLIWKLQLSTPPHTKSTEGCTKLRH